MEDRWAGSGEQCVQCRGRLGPLFHLLIPPFRTYIRYSPRWLPRRAVWQRILEPHLAAHSHSFVARTRYGARLRGNQRWIMHRCIYYFGLWEPLLTQWIAGSLKPGDTFVDVGANIGYFSLLAARCVGPNGSVVAVEPAPATLDELDANIRLNRFTNIRVVPAAATRSGGPVNFYRAPNDAESSTVPVPGSAYDSQVAGAPLPELLSEDELGRIRLIKVDVEGAELDVLAGLAPSIEKLREDAEIVVEVHPHLLALAARSVHELVRLLEDAGFAASWLPVDFSPLAHLDPPASVDPTPLSSTKDDLVHLIFSRRS